MVIFNQRRIITPKNIVLLGIILLSTYTYSTEFKLLSLKTFKPIAQLNSKFDQFLKTFKPVAQLNSKFAQLKFDKLLIQSVEAEHEKKIVIKSAKSFAALKPAKDFAGLKFKHVAEEDPEPEKEKVITEDLSQEDLSQEDLLEQQARQLFQELQQKHQKQPSNRNIISRNVKQKQAQKNSMLLLQAQKNPMLLLKSLTQSMIEESMIEELITDNKFNTYWKDIICKESDPNIMLPTGNTFFYQLLKNIEYGLKNKKGHYTYYNQIKLIELCLCLCKEDWQHGKPDMTIKNKKGNTILHQIMKMFNCNNSQLNCLMFPSNNSQLNCLMFPSNDEIHYIIYYTNSLKNLCPASGKLKISNLNQLLTTQNNNNMTPLYYLFTKFHPIQPTQIARRCIERIRDIQKCLNENSDINISERIRNFKKYINANNDINIDEDSGINKLIDHIATETYNHIFKISYKDMCANATEEFGTNPIEKLFSLDDPKSQNHQTEIATIVNLHNDEIPYNKLVRIDDSLLPLKKKMEESPFYKERELEKEFCQLRATKDYVDHKAKKRAIKAKKPEMLNFLMACKTSFNKNLLLPKPLRDFIFKLSFELITPLSAALNTIITKRAKNTLIIKDDLDCLIDAAAKSTLFSKNNKK